MQRRNRALPRLRLRSTHRVPTDYEMRTPMRIGFIWCQCCGNVERAAWPTCMRDGLECARCGLSESIPLRVDRCL